MEFETGDFKINWYNNIRINKLSKMRKPNRKIDFKYNVNFKGEKKCFCEEPLIMPNFNDKFT
jgi:hypothetical protein